MGYWTDTSYIKTGDSEMVAASLMQLLEGEGMRRIPRPPQRERVWYEPMQYDPAERNNLWAAAVFPGAPGWTVIKTAPLALLAQRPSGASQMRLVGLCGLLRAPGFFLAVYDSTGAVLAETDGEGNLLLSGLADLHADPLEFHGERLSEERYTIRFELLPLQQAIEQHSSQQGQYHIVSGEGVAQALEELLGGPNAPFCDNMTSVDTLICHKPLEAAGGHELYFEWPAGDRPEPARRTWEEIRAERSERK